MAKAMKQEAESVEIKVPRGVFEIVKATATESTRYAIGEVQFSRDGEHIVAAATNGRMMVELRWPHDGEADKFDPVLVARQQCLAAAKNADTLLRIDPAEEPKGLRRITMSAAKKMTVTASLQADEIRGQFPKYQEVIPDYSPEEASTFTVKPKLLMNMLSIMVAVLGNRSDEYGTAIKVTVPNDPHKPIVMRTAFADKETPLQAVGVLMPVKVS